jgi:hypothetical protein
MFGLHGVQTSEFTPLVSHDRAKGSLDGFRKSFLEASETEGSGGLTKRNTELKRLKDYALTERTKDGVKHAVFNRTG